MVNALMGVAYGTTLQIHADIDLATTIAEPRTAKNPSRCQFGLPVLVAGGFTCAL